MTREDKNEYADKFLQALSEIHDNYGGLNEVGDLLAKAASIWYDNGHDEGFKKGAEINQEVRGL